MQEQFFAAISHELRTPLNGIIGLSESLLVDPSIAQQEHSAKTLKIIKMRCRPWLCSHAGGEWQSRCQRRVGKSSDSLSLSLSLFLPVPLPTSPLSHLLSFPSFLPPSLSPARSLSVVWVGGVGRMWVDVRGGGRMGSGLRLAGLVNDILDSVSSKRKTLVVKQEQVILREVSEALARLPVRRLAAGQDVVFRAPG